jgi:hypothetical protein
MIDLISDTDPGCLSRIRLLSIPDPNGLYPWYALKKKFSKLTCLLVTWSVVSSPPGRRVAETSWFSMHVLLFSIGVTLSSYIFFFDFN